MRSLPMFMSSTNKLRKPHTTWTPHTPVNTDASTSRTMTIASDSRVVSISTSSNSLPATPQPLTPSEQYWAARALRAEALLEVELTHKKEVRTLGYTQDMKRERELGVLAKEYKEKHAALEKLLVFLLVLVVVLVLLIIYLATHYTRHSMLMLHKQQERWWSAIGASHFTIPILSPFTSVVEQETSVISAKLIGTLAAVAACLAYFVFRHWLGNKALVQSPGAPTSTSISSTTNTTLARITNVIDR